MFLGCGDQEVTLHLSWEVFSLAGKSTEILLVLRQSWLERTFSFSGLFNSSYSFTHGKWLGKCFVSIFFQISFVVVYEFNNGFSISICFIWCSTSLVSFWFVCIWPMAAFPKIVCTNTMYEEIPSLRKREDPWPTHSPQGEKEVASALAINDCEPTEIHRPWLYSEPVVIAWDFNSHHGEWGSRAHNQFAKEVSQ